MTYYYPLIVLCASIVIIILAYFTTKFVSGGFNSKIVNRNIKFIERMPLGVDKSLILFELDNHFYLMFLSKNGAQLIDKLDTLEIKEQMSQNVSFKEILSKFKNFKD